MRLEELEIVRGRHLARDDAREVVFEVHFVDGHKVVVGSDDAEGSGEGLVFLLLPVELLAYRHAAEREGAGGDVDLAEVRGEDGFVLHSSYYITHARALDDAHAYDRFRFKHGVFVVMFLGKRPFAYFTTTSSAKSHPPKAEGVACTRM